MFAFLFTYLQLLIDKALVLEFQSIDHQIHPFLYQ